MKTLRRASRVLVPLFVAIAAAACSTTYSYHYPPPPGVTNVQPRCLAHGSTCYYATDCCSLTCTNNVCVQ
ncbi:MAG TPA: hypothetical protein VEK07_00535 [Polyangiaceae bacterium]|nr:hypothetical protein [Polyangiaceae bacterium]